MKELFSNKKNLILLLVISIVVLALILTGGYFLFLAGDDDDKSNASRTTSAPPPTAGPSKTNKKKKRKAKPGPVAGKEFTLDSDRDERDYATVQATGAIRTPARILVRFGAAPKQPVKANSSITCLLATEGARTNLDTFTLTPPATRELKLPVPPKDAVTCTATANAQLTLAGKGRIKVFLTGIRRAGR